MDELKNRIQNDGKALSNQVLLVDSFLNHQIDIELMEHIGEEFARIFRDQAPTRVVTIESSGIAPALMTARALNIPLVVMKKATSSLLTEDILQTPVMSYTKGSSYQLMIKRQFIDKDDRVLIIDDFLANGEAALGAARLIENAGATVAGIGIVIEKAFQNGKKRLSDSGYQVESLASISYMNEGVVEFDEDK